MRQLEARYSAVVLQAVAIPVSSRDRRKIAKSDWSTSSLGDADGSLGSHSA